MAHTYRFEDESPYPALCLHLKNLLEGERDVTANLANASALISLALKNVLWCGFYLLKEGELVLGPFQGKPACIRIPLNRGVCGGAAAMDQTLRVENVEEFPGHIACDAESRSEIVIPLHKNGAVFAVLDIDSAEYGRFTPDDQRGLEAAAAEIERHLQPL